MSGGDGQRLDKWLWHARFARTRTAAQRLIATGSVRVNREKVLSSSRLVRPGDVLTLALGRGVRIVHVLAVAERRSSAEQAALLFSEHVPAGASPPAEFRPHGSADRSGARSAATGDPED
ncbi:RNA-binding S4 domain-containing protein [Propylenella binzhouense]|uniref:RNA-binding S4 domain-containing protein n=1 Tax=Propylenella binzhouense TaxID=2555902 RepID=A0A964T922_9HYPH|nr:RNA-binding S4 domain-containing protein [Propylenella binzhouense]MYZ50117.1 RNA-binding S4 domain-containing protein [Propylenella binzhouense]